ncbi:MAG: VirB4 family type IV secretion system protein [Terriglobia bacterium]
MTARELLLHYRKSRAFHSAVPIRSFATEEVFLTRQGACGLVVSLRGTDDECLTPERLEAISHALVAALRIFDERFRLYQYLIKTGLREIPRKEEYTSHNVESVVRDRIAFLDGKLSQIELYLVVLYEPAPRIGRRPGSSSEDRSQDISRLAAAVRSFQQSLADLFAPQTLKQQEVFRFFRFLLNLDFQKAGRVPLKSPNMVDYQAVASRLDWDRQGRLKLDQRQLRILSLKELPSFTTPNLFRALAAIPADLVLWSEWKRTDNPQLRKAVAEKRRFLWNFKRLAPGTVLAQATGRVEEVDADLEDDSARMIIRDLKKALVQIEAEGGYFGKFSFSLVLHGTDAQQLDHAASEAHRVLSTYEAEAVEETYGALAAYFAMLPGNHRLNVRRLWLQNTHCADLSFVYAPFGGSLEASEIQDEYLAAFETCQGAPFFFDPFHNHSFGISVFGPRGTGKSVLGNFLCTHAQKYGGYTFVFDIGGSFEENARFFGGSVLRLTLEEQSFHINPFSLPDTADNRKFLLNFLKLLMEADDTWSHVDDNQVAELIAGLYRQYVGTPLLRLQTFYALLPVHLRPRLAKWVEGGPYGTLFDHPTDTLTFSQFVVFDMQGVEEHADVVQPLLYWLFYRVQSVVTDPKLAGTFKLIAIDELWKYLQNQEVAAFVNSSIKMGRKHLLGVLLMTQSAGDLGSQTEMIRDNCKTTMFLANPNIDRTRYTETFDLNAKELDLLTTLGSREVLLKTPNYSKVLKLNLDAKSYWRYTTSGLERIKRRQAIDTHGEQAIELLASGAI